MPAVGVSRGLTLTHQWGERQERAGRTPHDCLGPWQPPRHSVWVSNALCHLKMPQRRAYPIPKGSPRHIETLTAG